MSATLERMIMPDFLFCTLEKEIASLQQASWWPLIFEEMSRASFQFYDPGKPIKTGSYWSSSNREQEGTIQGLLEAVSGGSEQLLAAFWYCSQHATPFYCEVSVRQITPPRW